ncbi:MAG: sugar ABC transporter ATP-binding protein [Candidatus Humimicrobiaceae bacterium]
MSKWNQFENILEINSLSKYFPGVQALTNVDFSIRRGEIHGLIGENGAGKSTLIKIIGGVLRKDTGVIRFENKDYNPLNSTEALHKGIATVYQELSLCENMNVAENLLINRHPRKGFIIDYSALFKKTMEYLEQFGLKVSPSEKVQNLCLAEREQIEILRAISYNPKLLILDEPTEPLSKPLIDRFFELLSDLKRQGVSILYISHNITEILKICDRVTVLRDGAKISTVDVNEITIDKLANLMVGRDLGEMYPERASISTNETILKVQDLSSGETIKDISFDLKRGEILGIAGLVGSGRTDLALTIFGYREITAGKILIHGKQVVIKTPKDAIRYGIAYLSEDRRLFGLFLPFTIVENLLSNNLKSFSRHGFVDNKKLTSVAFDYIKNLKIKASGPQQIVGNLSGGNQQKTLLAKWLMANPEILIFDEPTRGIDVFTKKVIHELLRKLVRDGMSIIMISSELHEILGMSDRIMIMDRGCVVDILENKKDITEEYIMNAIVNYKKGRNKDEQKNSG